MVSLRKLFLIPVALVTLAGIASAVPAAINCPLTLPSTGVLKAEGRTELLPQLAFSCTIANPAGTTAPFSISVYTSGGATFTSPATGAKAPVIGGTLVGGVAPTVTVTPNVITFTVNLKTIGGPLTLTIDGLYADASSIPQGGSMGLSLISASLNTLLADTGLFGTVPAPSPVLSVPNLAIALKSLSVADSYSIAKPPVLDLPACSTDTAFDVMTAGATGTNGTAFDTVVFTPVLGSALAIGNRVTLTVSNLPSGVMMYAPLTIGVGTLLGSGTTGNLVANLVAGYDANLAGGYLASVTAGTGAMYALLPASGTAVYEILFAGAATDPLTVKLFETSTGPVLAAMPVSVSAGYAPIGTTPVPRYIAGGVVSSGFLTTGPCASSLFFPYVVAGGGYDTGIAISSSGVFGDASKAASGQCVVSFMGKGAPMTTKTLDVTVGQTNAFDIMGSMPTANFYGYAVAKCNFKNATGYAFVANSTGGTASYLPTAF